MARTHLKNAFGLQSANFCKAFFSGLIVPLVRIVAARGRDARHSRSAGCFASLVLRRNPLDLAIKAIFEMGSIKKVDMLQILWKTALQAGFGSVIIASANLALAAEDSTKILNPIAAQSFPCLIQTISLAAMQVAIPIAIVTIIFAGLKFIFAGVSGNSAKVAEARKILLWAVIGTAVVVGSFVIANAAVELFGGESAAVECA